MKRLFLLTFSMILMVACQSGPGAGQMQLNGTIDGLKKGRIVLQKMEDSLLVGVDSTDVDGDAQFQFITDVPSPEIFFVSVQFKDSVSQSKSFPFFAEAKQIGLQSTLEEFPATAKVSGSQNQDLLEEYKGLINRYNERNLEYIEGQLNAIKDGNDSLNGVFVEKQERLLRSKYLATVNFAKNHSDKEIAPYLMLTEAFDAHIRYLDTVYNGLEQKIKDSKYGIELESFIAQRKAQGL